MKTKECGDLGKLEYRLPNIPETMMLLGEMGLNTKKLNDAQGIEENELFYTAKLIMNLRPYIGTIDLKIGDEAVTTFDEVLNHFEMMVYLNEIAGEVFEAISGGGKKKTLRKKQ